MNLILVTFSYAVELTIHHFALIDKNTNPLARTLILYDCYTVYVKYFEAEKFHRFRR